MGYRLRWQTVGDESDLVAVREPPMEPLWKSALSEAQPSFLPKLPWEQGVMSCIFGGDTFGELQMPKEWQDRPPMEPSEAAGSAAPRAVIEANDPYGTSGKAKRMKKDDWPTARASKQSTTSGVDLPDVRRKRLGDWLELIMAEPGGSSAGRSLLKFDGDVKAMTDQLTDIFHDKRDNTLSARFYVVKQLKEWLTREYTSEAWLPLCEDKVYRYCKAMISDNAPATRLQRLRESLAFSRYTWKPDGAEEVLSSALIRGAASRQYENKRLLKQRDPLTPPDVRALESVLASDDCRLLEKQIAGHALFLTMGRVRHADTFHLTAEPWVEGDCVEATTMHTKNSSRRGVGRTEIPLVALNTGLSGEWCGRWLEVRRALGLEASEEQPLFPKANPDGSWSAIPVSTHDFGQLMADLLRQYSTKPVGGRNLGSHSCKATLLQWAAMGGLGREDRRTLEYHLPQDKSVTYYGRDELRAPLAKLQVIVEAVAKGQLDPEQPRGEAIRMLTRRFNGLFEERMEERETVIPEPLAGLRKSPVSRVRRKSQRRRSWPWRTMW